MFIAPQSCLTAYILCPIKIYEGMSLLPSLALRDTHGRVFLGGYPSSACVNHQIKMKSLDLQLFATILYRYCLHLTQRFNVVGSSLFEISHSLSLEIAYSMFQV